MDITKPCSAGLAGDWCPAHQFDAILTEVLSWVLKALGMFGSSRGLSV